MIKFFRKIRQQLLTDNKFSKYLLYAIGEIFLVVIGILIALQINTWNEKRKNSEFEKEILGLIDQNLERDSLLISAELLKTETANSLTDRLLKDAENKKFHDSLNYWMGKIITFERFKSQSSGFEVLKSRGIEIITNKDLQIALINYYDVELYNLYESLNDLLGSFNADWIPVVKKEYSVFQWMIYAKPRNQKEFLEKPNTTVLFRLYQDNRKGQIRRMNSALQNITLIRSLIKESNQ